FMRYQKEFGLNDYDANLLTSDVEWARWFEEAIQKGGEPKAICNWMNSEFAKLINEEGILARQSKITPEHLVQLTNLIADGTISGKIAKKVFTDAYQTGKMPADLVKESGSTQITDDSAVRPIIEAVLAANPDVVEKYKAGQQSVRGFLVGQIMRESQGRADPAVVNKLLEELLQ
ncbi:MAG: Asp-tRNA(Asn)/Glu-tRNA(Gln) amidotransferase GatCAB subunit B, partial [Armatimonadota bacterium]